MEPSSPMELCFNPKERLLFFSKKAISECLCYSITFSWASLFRYFLCPNSIPDLRKHDRVVLNQGYKNILMSPQDADPWADDLNSLKILHESLSLQIFLWKFKNYNCNMSVLIFCYFLIIRGQFWLKDLIVFKYLNLPRKKHIFFKKNGNGSGFSPILHL